MRDTADSPERARWLHLARSGSQSQRAIWVILPARGASHIISKNNVTCPITKTIRLGDVNYSYRCDIPREDWEFGNDFTSVVTEVNYTKGGSTNFQGWGGGGGWGGVAGILRMQNH